MIMIKSVPKLSVIFLLLLSMLAGTLSSCISRNNTDDIQTGIASDESTSGQNENESQTNEVIDIVTFPDGNLPDLSSLLQGEDNSINSVYDFRNASVSSLKTDGDLTFVQQSDYTSGEYGLSTDNSDWKSVGFSTEITSPDYTVEAKFTVSENEKDGNLNAFFAGIRCAAADNLFIDGGIWFAFRDNTVSAYVKDGFQVTLTDSLPFSAKDGIVFKAAESAESDKIEIYANKKLIATVKIEDKVYLYSDNGKELATCPLDYIAHGENSYGYFRTMSHFANSATEYISLNIEDKKSYTPKENVFAFMDGLEYAFEEKASFTSDGGVLISDGVLLADSEMLADMFGFEYTKENDTVTLKKDSVTLKFTSKETKISVNDEQYNFTTIYPRKDSLLIDVEKFASMLGYAGKYDSESKIYYIVNDTKNLTQEKTAMLEERFQLYKDVVYNYDDVECDNTGVGLYEKSDPNERLVGIAYSTWHTNTRDWGNATWDLPLLGKYTSDNRDIIYRHGVMLAEADVDFVFIDWSNNTGYDPETMRDSRPDFRMIEEATDLLFEIWSEIPNAPKICIFAGPGHNGVASVTSGEHQRKVDQIYRDYVEKYPDMYFYYEGKPLLICYGATPTQYTANPSSIWPDDERFTVRWMTGYVGQQDSLFNPRTLLSQRYWSWEERGAQTYTVYNGTVEAVTCTAATRPQGEEGDEGYIPAAGRENGATLKKQFQRAINLGAKIVLLVSWNEWTTGEQPSPEISKDLEPSQIHGTFYYDLMREQIKKFKGKVTQTES